jgi:hypothetical protein
VHLEFWLGNLRKGDQLDDPGVDGRNVINLSFRSGVGESWTGLIWDKWRAVVNAVMKLRSP